GLRFTIECTDKATYPDNILVLCPDRNSDLSCEIVTRPREFKFLNMMGNHVSEGTPGEHESREKE
ncbi:MAG: hypothetical protein AAF680_14325, partial [Pseudomonadota bacterium]